MRRHWRPERVIFELQTLLEDKRLKLIHLSPRGLR